MTYAIPLKDHPSNLDPTACIIQARVGREFYDGRAIFRVIGGYVVCVGADMALEDLFPTEASAIDAQNAYLET
jgi:hypothetical protein